MGFMVGKNSLSRNLFLIFNYIFFLILILICIYPMWYVFVQSVSADTRAGTALFWPNRFTLNTYIAIFRFGSFYHALLISVARTVIGAVLTVFSCMWLGYLFSKEEMPFRRFMYRMLIVTMYVSGGLIPTFLVMRAYGLVGTFSVYILPAMINAFFVILIKTFIEQLPSSVEESAMIDGAGSIKIFIRIIFPMSLPIAATIAVFAAVAQWNAWVDNMIYNADVPSLTTLQFFLYRRSGGHWGLAYTMLTIMPIILVYPLLQRFFVKGITIGAIKG